jgi:transposase
MLVAEEAVEIRVLKRQGKSIREIARLLQVSRNTVRRYLRVEGMPRYEREARPSKLDPYKDYIEERVKAAARTGFRRPCCYCNRTFLDFAHHHGFVPRLCRPYRAKTKGKVERFIRYLRASFYVPLASQLNPEGLIVDRDTANARAGTWLLEVANARVHATTGEVPLVRLELERERLPPMPAPWPGLMIRPARSKRPLPMPSGYQHSLRVY